METKDLIENLRRVVENLKIAEKEILEIQALAPSVFVADALVHVKIAKVEAQKIIDQIPKI